MIYVVAKREIDEIAQFEDVEVKGKIAPTVMNHQCIKNGQRDGD